MAEQSGVPTGDDYGERRPTSHERRAGAAWNSSYIDGTAPWDIGRPQPAIARLAEQGAFAGAVLDAGCGSGEHALLVASLGLEVLGVDVAEAAISIARRKATERGLEAEFAVADALQLAELGRTFETVLDCGLFHTLDHEERRSYVASLASATAPGGRLHVLCFSDQGPALGPHPVAEEELRSAFGASAGWSVVSIAPDRIEARLDPPALPAWLATVARVPAP